MGSIATMADRVIVMYAGRCVESGTAEDILLDPRHPYTQGLIACIPHLCRDGGKRSAPLQEIPGMVPSIRDIGPGCAFAPAARWPSPTASRNAPVHDVRRTRYGRFRAAPSERSLP
ncbi:MAG: oligopeptide/dipeptide ABC transporter ATP-binding protein [Bilophila wadsworthia]